jgi:hypothetical protein
MLDRFMRHLVDPALERAGRRLADRGVGADALTVAGLGVGLAAALCVALRLDLMALALFITNRVLDGLDGAVARASVRTDRGGFLDIVVRRLRRGAARLRAPRSGAECGAGRRPALRLLRQRRELPRLRGGRGEARS